MSAVSNAVTRFVNRHRGPMAIGSLVLTVVGFLCSEFKILDPKPSAATATAGALGLVVADAPKLLEALKGKPEDAADQAKRAPEQLELYRSQLQSTVQSIVDSGLVTLLGTRLPLDLVMQPAEVDNPLVGIFPAATTGQQTVPFGTPIETVFGQLGQRMLILGAGGSGKSGLLYELAGHLLEESRVKSAAPVPVIVNLASWSSTVVSLNDWLVAELHTTYGVDRSVGQSWLETDQLLLMLDGLDTVGAQACARCVDDINDFMGTHGQLPLVVASRQVEYETLGKKLRLRGAVVVQPLTKERVLECIKAPDMAGVQQVVAADEGLLELMTTLWFLGIVVRTYQGMGPELVPTGGTPEALRAQILSDYVDFCLRQPHLKLEPAFGPEDAHRWLGWLAGRMVERNQEVFYYDLMQPDLLPKDRRWLATFGVGVVAGLLTGVLAWVGNVSVFGAYALILGVVAGIVVGMAAYEPEIAPTTPLHLSMPQLRRGLFAWLSFGPLFGLLAGLSLGLIAQFRGGSFSWVAIVVTGIIAGLCLGIFFALVGALENRPYVEPEGPGDAIASTVKNALRGGAMMGLLSAALAGIGGGVIVELVVLPKAATGDLVFWVVLGIIVQGIVISVLFAALGFDPGVRIGLRPSWRTAVVIGLGVTIVDAQVAALMLGDFGTFGTFLGSITHGEVPRGVIAGVLLAILVGVGTAICHGMLRGGGAYFRHKALLSLLRREGAISPKYLQFLAYASRIRLLQRRGGGYQFLHRFLLEHFAQPGAVAAPATRGGDPLSGTAAGAGGH